MKVKAKRKNGEVVEGYFCYAPFVKKAEDLSEEEKETAAELSYIGTEVGGGKVEGYYLVTRQAVQVIEEGTLQVVAPTGLAAEAEGQLPQFVEIVEGSAREFTGYTDKNGKGIYLGDRINYQAGIGDFEVYEVVFNNGRYTTAPAWPWGCNFSPFSEGRCELVEN